MTDDGTIEEGIREHSYIPVPGTERRGWLGPLQCEHCGLPAEGDIYWPCFTDSDFIRSGQQQFVAARREFALTLARFHYGEAFVFPDDEPEMFGNYLSDALEILVAYPHLLSFAAQRLIESKGTDRG